jgi:hypothetical protein
MVSYETIGKGKGITVITPSIMEAFKIELAVFLVKNNFVKQR